MVDDAPLDPYEPYDPDVVVGRAGTSRGTESPAVLATTEGPSTIMRSFAFIDMCGSTSYLEHAGPRATVKLVSDFRALVREVVALRGVRASKWLGDGAMLVGVTSGPIVAAAVELCARMVGAPLAVRAGVAVSPVLLFDGDDYLGRGANFAARLCAIAEPGEILCDTDCTAEIPDWVSINGHRTVHVRGMGDHDVLIIGPSPELELPPLA